MTLLISGCPATLFGVMKNQSTHEIHVLPPFDTKNNWQIKPGESDSVQWYQECITIKTNNHMKYFSSYPIPENTIKKGTFFGEISVTFKDEKLYFIDNSGNLIEAKQIATCGNP